MRCWIRFALPLATLALGACTTPPSTISSGGGEDSSGSSGTTNTTPGTTTPAEDTTGGSQGGSATGTTTVDPTATVGDTTMGVDPSTTSDGTTMGVDPTTGGESSSGGPPPECMMPSDCPANETCNVGMCEDACGGSWGAGSYDYCLDQYGQFAPGSLCGAGADHSCVWGGTPIEAATCMAQNCTTACDCPAPPGTGNAVVTCDLLTPSDTDNDCFLDCENGETCPDGMVCRTGTLRTYCAQPVQPLAQYGDCGSVAAPCANGGTCAMYNGYSVCISLCPGGVGDCDPTPPGSTYGPACQGAISPPAGADCIIPCIDTPDCPAGMTCVNETGDLFCMW